MTTADEILTAAGRTYAERHAVYGDNWRRVGLALAAMYPDGLVLKTAEDHTRYYLFVLAIVKASRYANNFSKGGHADSARDAAVYWAMLEAVDAP